MATITPINLELGAIGQLKGPFSPGDIINFGTNKLIKFSIQIGQKDFMPLYNQLNIEDPNYIFEDFDVDNPPTYLINKISSLLHVTINNVDVFIKRNGTYESDTGVLLQNITFPEGAPASVTVDYVVLET